MSKMKTPASILKGIPRKADRKFVDAYDDGYPVYGDTADRTATPSPNEVLASTSVSTVLAHAMVQTVLSRADIARIAKPGSLAMVVGVPGPDWIGPIAHALTFYRAWTEITKRAGASKVSDKPSVGNDTVAGSLAAGRSVLGVSTAPERHLPATLMAAADLRVELRVPTPRVIRATIRLVTGRRAGLMPDDIVLGLGFDDITACIRKGSRPRDCIRRLKAASASKRTSASDLKDVPRLRDTVGHGAAQTHGLALIDAVEAYRRGERSFVSYRNSCREFVICDSSASG